MTRREIWIQTVPINLVSPSKQHQFVSALTCFGRNSAEAVCRFGLVVLQQNKFWAHQMRPHLKVFVFYIISSHLPKHKHYIQTQIHLNTDVYSTNSKSITCVLNDRGLKQDRKRLSRFWWRGQLTAGSAVIQPQRLQDPRMEFVSVSSQFVGQFVMDALQLIQT